MKHLSPSEDYKSSILAGYAIQCIDPTHISSSNFHVLYISSSLRPELIADIAARGLNFWVYQTTQEHVIIAGQLKSVRDRLAEEERRVLVNISRTTSMLFH